MLVAVLSDIHANFHALDVVLNYCKYTLKVDRYWILGDSLGYGPYPIQVWDRVSALKPEVWLSGNHDWYIAPYNLEEPEGRGMLLPPVYRQSGEQIAGPRVDAWKVAQRHRQICTTEILSALCDLPPTMMNEDLSIYLAHAIYAPDDNESALTYRIENGLNIQDFYTNATQPALWDKLSSKHPTLHIAGHTHIPMLCGIAPNGKKPEGSNALSGNWFWFGNNQEPLLETPYRLEAGTYYHINPGSVGFPRGKKPCPSFCVIDLDEYTVTFYEVCEGYDSEFVREAMKAQNYPLSVYSQDNLQVCTGCD